MTHSRSAPATRASLATVKAGGSAERFQKWVVLRRKRAATAESSPPRCEIRKRTPPIKRRMRSMKSGFVPVEQKFIDRSTDRAG